MLLNESFYGAFWITLLQRNWQEDFWAWGDEHEMIKSIFDASWGSDGRFFFGDEEKLSGYTLGILDLCVGFGFWGVITS